jgi:hypothetical protein
VWKKSARGLHSLLGSRFHFILSTCPPALFCFFSILSLFFGFLMGCRCRSNLREVKVLGRGAFGLVRGVRDKATGCEFALKALAKPAVKASAGGRGLEKMVFSFFCNARAAPAFFKSLFLFLAFYSTRHSGKSKTKSNEFTSPLGVNLCENVFSLVKSSEVRTCAKMYVHPQNAPFVVDGAV